MNALQKIVRAIGNRVELTLELQSALAKKAKGNPGWDANIAKLQSQLFGSPAPSSSRIIHGSHKGKDFVPYSSGPEGSYDFAKDIEDRKRIQQGGMNSVLVQSIPVSTTGLVTGFNPFYCNHNGLQILARTMDDNGNITESSDTARVFIRINNPSSPWLPMGFLYAAQGITKSDNLVYEGYIDKFWLYVSTPTEDPTFQPFLVIALLRSVSLYGPGGGSNLYSPPNTSSQPINATTASGGSSGTSSSGTSGAGATPGGGGGGGGAGGGGTGTGGGGGGGQRLR